MGRLGDAELNLRRALEGNENVLGPDHDETLLSAARYGRCLQHLDRSSEGLPLVSRALAGYERTHGRDHMKTIAMMVDYSVFLNYMGRLTDARPYARQAFDDSKRVLGRDHPVSRHAGLTLHKCLIDVRKKIITESFSVFFRT